MTVVFLVSEHVETFSAQAQDFSSAESWQLDLWVFRSVKLLFTQAKKAAPLENLLNQNQIIFFLHLVGLDTAGHSVKPTSKSVYPRPWLAVIFVNLQHFYLLGATRKTCALLTLA